MHGSWVNGQGRARRRRLLAVPTLVVVALAGFAVAPAGAVSPSTVSGAGICFGYPAAGGCRFGFGGTTTASPGSTLALRAGLTASGGVSSGQQIVLDGSGSGITFSGNQHDYQVNNDSTSFGCSVPAVSVTNSGQTVSVSMPSGCSATPGQKIVVLAGSTLLPNTTGSFSLNLSTTADPTGVGTNSLSIVTVPSAPKNLVASPDLVSIDLSWDAPDTNGGSVLTGYNAYCSSGTPDTNGTPSATTDGSTTSTTVNGLPAHETFNCVVTAVNDVGQSAASNLASARPYQKPSEPTGFTVTRGNESVALTWGRPGDVGSSPILAYHAYCSTTGPPSDPGDLCATFGPAKHEGVVRGLTNGVSYFIGITAENKGGESGMAGPAIVTPAGPPSRPVRVRAIPLAGAIRLRWKAPASDGGDAITGYQAACSTDPNPQIGGPHSASSTTNRVRITGLDPTLYYCIVVAENTVGQSKPSKLVSTTPT